MKNLQTIWPVSSATLGSRAAYISRCLLLALLLSNDAPQFLLVPIFHIVWNVSAFCFLTGEKSHPSSCPLGYLRTGWLSRLSVRHWGHARIYTCFLYCQLYFQYISMVAYPFHNAHSWSRHKAPVTSAFVPVICSLVILSWDLRISLCRPNGKRSAHLFQMVLSEPVEQSWKALPPSSFYPADFALPLLSPLQLSLLRAIVSSVSYMMIWISNDMANCEREIQAQGQLCDKYELG